MRSSWIHTFWLWALVLYLHSQIWSWLFLIVLQFFVQSDWANIEFLVTIGWKGLSPAFLQQITLATKRRTCRIWTYHSGEKAVSSTQLDKNLHRIEKNPISFLRVDSTHSYKYSQLSLDAKYVLIHCSRRKILFCRMTGSKIENREFCIETGLLQKFSSYTFLPSHGSKRCLWGILKTLNCFASGEGQLNF